jgi:hypothetical protein
VCLGLILSAPQRPHIAVVVGSRAYNIYIRVFAMEGSNNKLLGLWDPAQRVCE